MAFDILSPSHTKKEMTTKFKLYQQHNIEEYYLYDPKKNRLQGWLRQAERLTAIARMEGWRSPRLGITFSTSEGELVLFHPGSERFVSDVEVVEQRDRQRERADRERLEKELEKQRANRKRAEKERERAEQEQTQLTLEAERQKNQQLLDRLLQLGVDPNSFP